MSPRAMKKCARDGCETRGTGRYCPEHVSQWPKGGTRPTTQADREWRIAILNRGNWRCQIRGPHCTRRATQADHIRNVAQGGAPLDLGNGQGACEACHREKSLREATIGRGATPRR